MLRSAALRASAPCHRCRSTIKTVHNPTQAFVLKVGEPSSHRDATQSRAGQRHALQRLAHPSPARAINRAPQPDTSLRAQGRGTISASRHAATQRNATPVTALLAHRQSVTNKPAPISVSPSR